MKDEDVIRHIGELVSEEHKLQSSTVGKGHSGTDRVRLHELEVALDQCWDLLRQRRARRRRGEDPDDAHVRPASVVENYRQ